MPKDAHLYEIFIASPTDVAAERDIVREAISAWNRLNTGSRGVVLRDIGWETDATPDYSKPGQEVINSELVDKCDFLIGIFWTRLGSPTHNAESGTIDEINTAIKQGKKCVVYFSDKEVKPSDVDQEQYQQLLEYKERIKSESYFGSFSDDAEFKKQVSRHINDVINKILEEEQQKRAAENQARQVEQAQGIAPRDLTNSVSVGGDAQIFLQPERLAHQFDISLASIKDAETSVRMLIESRYGVQDIEDERDKEIAKTKRLLENVDFRSLLEKNSVPPVVNYLEDITIPSIYALTAIGKYADDSSPDWTDIAGLWVEKLCIKDTRTSYIIWTKNVFYYPALLAFYALGISALKHGKIGFLSDIFSRYTNDDRGIYNRPKLLIESICPYGVFYDRQDVHKLIEPGFENRLTPVSDHLSKIIKEIAYANDNEQDFFEWFDLFEFLVSLKFLELKAHFGSMYSGSFMWRRETEGKIVSALQDAAANRGKLGYSIVRLFGNIENLKAVAQNYDEMASKQSRNRLFDGGAFPYTVGKVIEFAENGNRVADFYDQVLIASLGK
jgi:hypothetical protein